MKVMDAEFAQHFVRLCSEGYSRGWHERNGGNLSYRMTQADVDMVKDQFFEREVRSTGCHVSKLGGEYFLVKATGGFMGNMARDPEHNMGIIRLDEKGENYSILWGFSGNMHPTSELPSHLMNLEVVKERTNGKYRIVYHCHPANIIALTFVLPLTDEAFTKALWTSMTECPIIFPAGVGVLPWMVCGGEEIGTATSNLMKKYDIAIWAHHGIFCTGEDFDSVFGMMDAVEKSAEIEVKVLSMGGARQTMTDENILALEKPFGITVNREFIHTK
ncbi:MAG: rhamnulose-1-phosphate aldolase [Mollicutes bacterium]|nr:rhamnulose-1-phosphate aldolase [bacterium]MDD6801167.1 rhamnulose-1-phosphate aldolase [Mollicutes bacterium]MDD7064549.1 rhamnulose-1-phosphate aldolase [Mollicutes bacterium]MDY2686893.1 rhamnulose-1-phosphate aldolase [Candidatus Enteromonas sp.]MDY5298309.1 rhamnulose-1-phosphate aldolase [Candidatus Enteromonas sp.]